MEKSFAIATITKKGERALKGGHPWVFEGEVKSIKGAYENGDLIHVFSEKERFLGTGFINDNSKIRIRVISKNANDRFDEDFYRRRLKWAIDYRKTVMGDDFSSCRLIFGEADMFPGLTVDKFSDVLSVQVLSLGIERIKPMIFSLLKELLENEGHPVNAIYERNDVAIRQKEGLIEYKEFYDAPGLSTDKDGHVIINENGILFDVDYINGQKTGFFLDQKYNRLLVRKLSKGKRVLDCFTHTGAFALNAAFGGAEYVNAVDISEDALNSARKNAALNSLNLDFTKADVFDLLTEMEQSKKSYYDFIILDPPSFTKSSETVKNAYFGYKEINKKAMKILPRGGYLATCSCSHFMKNELFMDMLKEAAAEASVSLRQIECRQQSADHPILWNVPETDYLKFYVFQVV